MNESTLVYANVCEGKLVGELVKRSKGYDGDQGLGGGPQLQYTATSTTATQDLYHAALFVCSAVMGVDQKSTMSSPPTIQDMDNGEI